MPQAAEQPVCKTDETNGKQLMCLHWTAAETTLKSFSDETGFLTSNLHQGGFWVL